MQLCFYQEAVNFFGAVYPGYQGLFNIGGTAGAGGKSDQRGNIAGVFFFQ